MSESNLELTTSELAEVERAIRTDKRPEVRQRAVAIRMLHLGKSPNQVAENLAVSLATVYNWRTRWQAGGLEGLANRPKSGRPGIADEAYCRKLEETLAHEPSELGYEFALWTVDRLRTHLDQETGKTMSPSRFRALLKREGYRYRRPKYDLGHLQDRQAKADAQELLEELKKGSRQTMSNSSLLTKRP